jgi:hypothetical protein
MSRHPTFVTFAGDGQTHWIATLSAFKVTTLCGQTNDLPADSFTAGPALTFGLLRSACPRCRELAVEASHPYSAHGAIDLSLTPV